MYTCIICKENKNTILNLSCKHQMCLPCLIKLNHLQCSICHKNLLNEIPKEIVTIINSKPIKKYNCPYHDNDIECDASCFI